MPELTYNQYDWGDGIRGTKSELQALGLGKGLAYPGEPGGPKRKLTVRDPRGFEAQITAESGHRYWVALSFPAWPQHPRDHEDQEFAPGIKLRAAVCWDVYVGTADRLIEQGLAPAEKFPGQPGMGKKQVSLYGDGTASNGLATLVHRGRMSEAGARVIATLSRSTYSVSVSVGEDERCRRREAENAAEKRWKETVRALPRPIPLTHLVSTKDEPRGDREMLEAMGVLHRRKIPVGWRVIIGSRDAATS